MFILAVFCGFIPFLVLAEQQPPLFGTGPNIYDDYGPHYPPNDVPEPIENCANTTKCMAKVSKLSEQCTKDMVAKLAKEKSVATDECLKDTIDFEMRQRTLDTEKSVLLSQCLKALEKDPKACPKLIVRRRKIRQTQSENYYDYGFGQEGEGDFHAGFGLPNDYPKSCEEFDKQMMECHSLYWCSQQHLCELCIEKTEFHGRMVDLQIDHFLHEGKCRTQPPAFHGDPMYPMPHELINGNELPHP